MRKLILAAVCAALTGLATAPALANNDQACMAELCLGVLADPAAGGFAGALPEQCLEVSNPQSGTHRGVKEFFSIKKRRKGKFNPGGTVAARKEWLDECKSGNSRTKAAIIAKFGHVPDMPPSIF